MKFLSGFFNRIFKNKDAVMDNDSIFISKELFDIILKVYDKYTSNNKKLPRKITARYSNFDDSWVKVFVDYNFNWVDFAIDDPRKISGLSVDVLKKHNIRGIPAKEDRKSYGNYLRIGKIVSLLVKSDTIFLDEYVSRIADTVMLAIRRRNPLTPYTVNVTDDIVSIYNGKSAVTSCMSGRSPSSFDIYNDHGFKIAFIKDSNDCVVARALIHDKVLVDPKSKKIVKILDRIYFRNDDALSSMLNFARENNYYTKYFGTGANIFGNESTGDQLRGNLLIESFDFKFKYSKFPYIDTFFNYVSHKGKFYLSTPVSDIDNSTRFERITFFRDPQGYDGEGAFVREMPRCAICGEPLGDVYRDGAFHEGGFYCNDCFSANFSACSQCGEIHDNMVMVSIGNMRYCQDCSKLK